MKTRNNLCEHFPDKVFIYWVGLALAMPHYFLKIATLAVLHDNVDFLSFLVDEMVVVLYDARVLQIAQNIHFGHDLLLLFFVHTSVV